MIYSNLFFNFVAIYFVIILIFFTLSKLTLIFISEEPKNYQSLLYGFSFFIIICNFLYFSLKLEVNQIFYTINFLCLIIFLREIFRNQINIKNYFKNILIIFAGCLPAFFIFFYLTIYHGEQYYVFRGNQYDYFNYISQSTLFKKYSIEEIINNKDLLSQYFPYKNMVNFHLDIRPSISLYLSIFSFEKINIFLNSFILKTFAFNLIFFASYSFFRNYEKKSLYLSIYSLTFTFSFWVVYIYEIDSIAQLFSMSLCIIYMSKLLSFLRNKKNDEKIVFELTLILSAILLVYPEQGIIICLISLFMFIVNFDYIKKYFLQNYKYIIRYACLLIIVLLPNYKGTIFFLFEQSKVGLTNVNNFWGYFGAFILGEKNIILLPDIVENIKVNISNSDSNFSIFKNIHNLQIDSGFKFYLLNFLPALFGMFHLTVGQAQTLNLHVLFLFFLNLLIFYVIFFNLRFIFIKRYSIEKNLFLSSIIIFSSISFVLIFNNSLWGIIKLFFYMSFIYYFFIIFPLILKKNTQLSIILIILINLFPFSYFQHTKTFAKNSMPTIMKPYLKEDIKWGLNDDLTQCGQILSKIDDFFVLKYLGIYVQSKTNLLLNKTYNKSKDKMSCEIIFYNKKFKIIKNEIY